MYDSRNNFEQFKNPHVLSEAYLLARGDPSSLTFCPTGKSNPNRKYLFPQGGSRTVCKSAPSYICMLLKRTRMKCLFHIGLILDLSKMFVCTIFSPGSNGQPIHVTYMTLVIFYSKLCKLWLPTQTKRMAKLYVGRCKKKKERIYNASCFHL